MTNWLKRLFKKKEDAPKGMPPLPFTNSYQTFNNSDFQQHLEDAIKLEEKRRKQAIDEIAKLHPVTQDILKDLEYTDIHTQYYFTFTPREVQMLETGKVIDGHVRKAVYNKRVKDVIDE